MAGQGQAPAIVRAAELLLGQAHKTSSPPKYYFGSDATIKVDSDKGEFFDYQTEVGGDIYEMCRQYLPPEHREAPADVWLKAQGIFIDLAGVVVELPEDEADERALIGLLLVKPEFLTMVEEEISASDFVNHLHAQMFIVFGDGQSQDYAVDMAMLIAAMGGDPKREVMPGFTLAQYIARVAADTPMNIPEPEQVARALARSIARQSDEDQGIVEHEAEPSEPAALPPFPVRLGAVRWADMHRPRARYEFTVKNIIPRGEMVVIYGRRQSGKSFFAFDLAMSIARELTYFGWKPNGHKVIPGLVIYAAVEGQSGFVDVRMPAYEQHHGLKPGMDLPFVCLTKRFNLFRTDQDLLLLIEEVKVILLYFKVRLEVIVIDTYNKATTGSDEVKGVDVAIIIERLEKIREAFNCGIWLVHHENAGGGMRGHTSLGDNFETVIRVENNKAAFDDNRRPIRTATLEKQREGDNESWPFVLEKVEIGRDADGEPITSCVVQRPASEFTDTAPRTQDEGFKINHPSTRQYYRCLVEAMREFGGPLTPEMNVRCPKGTWVVHLEKWREVCLRKIASSSGAKDPGDTVRKGTAAAATKFEEAGLIGSDMPWVWITDKKVQGFPALRFAENIVDLTGAPINSNAKTAEFPDDELPLR